MAACFDPHLGHLQANILHVTLFILVKALGFWIGKS
jgi:hypothetical protein